MEEYLHKRGSFYNNQYYNSVYHSGVLGMHWGVRHDKKAILKGKVLRVATTTNLSDHMFVTQTKTENKYWQEWLKDKVPNGKVINLNMKLKDSLVGPSEKERVDELINQLKNKKLRETVQNKLEYKLLRYDPAKIDRSKFSPELSAQLTAYEQRTKSEVNSRLNNMGNMKDKLVVAATTYVIYGDSKTRTKFLNSFAQKGYEFVTDDAGNWDTNNSLGKHTNAIILSKSSINSRKIKSTIIG